MLPQHLQIFLVCNSYKQGSSPTLPQYKHQSQEINTDTLLLFNPQSLSKFHQLSRKSPLK